MLDRACLFEHIYNKGTQGKAFRMIKALYNWIDNRVIFGSFVSDIFAVSNGVKQGCILSPCLFNLVISDMESLLETCNGVHIWNKNVKGLFYAYDIILMACNKEDVLNMLQVADLFGKKWGLAYNDDKSKIMVIGQRLGTVKWQLSNKLPSETKSYKY